MILKPKHKKKQRIFAKNFFMFNRKTILLSFLLLLPAIAVYIFYFINSPQNHVASGFIQSDMYSYMAEARQYADGESNGLLYSNPFDGDKNAPKIYFQPQIFFLGMILKYVGLNPSTIFLLFGLLFGWLFMVAAISLYRQFFEIKSKISVFGLIVFIYGGGALFLSGFISAVFNPNGFLYADFLKYDPGFGWWMLNLGRNLIYPMESYYHFLILITFVLFFKKQHLWVCFILAILSWSHPFYGIEFLTVFGSIYLFEFIRHSFFVKTEKPKLLPLALILILAVIHVYYYLVFLPSFPSHQSLMNQWKINWSHSGVTLIFAYIFGVVLTIFNIKLNGGFSKFFSDYKNRVLGIWFIVCFLFVNHNWLIPSYQPLHFDKGYVLAPLWLMGLSSLVPLFKKIKEKTNFIIYRLAIILIIIILLSDNLAWFAMARGDRNSYLSNSEKETLQFLNENFSKQDLLISNNDEFALKAMTFTSIRSLMSHGYNTPFYEIRKNDMKKFFKNETFTPLTTNTSKTLVCVMDNFDYKKTISQTLLIDSIFENDKFIVFKEFAH